MKSLFFIFSLMLASVAGASFPVEGKLYYELPSGELAERNVTLEVPERGEGEVILSGDNFEWKTKLFRSYKVKGRTTFVAVFRTEFQNKKSTVAISGSYLKGSNKIIYYGDVYKKKGHGFLFNLAGFDYIGGFKFSYDR